MTQNELIPGEEITLQKVSDMVASALMHSRFDADGDLIVDVDGDEILLTHEKGVGLLRYVAIYDVSKAVPLGERHELVNRMNDEMVFTRFTIMQRDEGKMIADYGLQYESGLTAHQVVRSLRMFAKATNHAVWKCDKAGLLD